MTRWTEQDFDRLSWHDNHVHAVRVHEGEHGPGRLEIDLDFIVEWLRPSDESFRFLVAPATLIFHRVTDLKVALDYASCGTLRGQVFVDDHRCVMIWHRAEGLWRVRYEQASPVG
jgi:hypothetical protein